ncbi:hypothetical protein [Thalassotalea castellviae]|uniref:Two pore domain potassium channel family protein n=1 Tax=Thalassotalea castellviae TaxID=3075612 RepID=A0ABU3A4D7_9GAMM|nr:hypothetical protein [Thalassotalea sp. W431]MDT0604770.1 hypothetical protein [Thalassotalea sp. W431]
MFESLKQDVISLKQFIFRLFRFFIFASVFLLLGLIPGVIGFLFIEDLRLIEACINALSLLGGLDSPYPLNSHVGKVFTAVYGLFIETIFLLATATLLAPIIHRVIHKMHAQARQ